MRWLKKKERFIAKIFQRVGEDLVYVGKKEVDVSEATFSYAKQTFVIDKKAVAYSSGYTHYYLYQLGVQEPILIDKKRKTDAIKGRVIDLVVKERIIRQLTEGLTENTSVWKFLGVAVGCVLLGAFGCYMVLDLMGMVI